MPNFKDCQNKIQVKSKSGTIHFVGCGVCGSCRTKRLRSWIHRLGVEEEASVSSFFITLTYDNENIEWTEKTDKQGNNLPTLNKKTVQKFIKLLRYHENEQHKQNGTIGLPLKYYAVGEYGSKYHRPHYHIIVYNLHYHYHSLTKSWDKGNIHIGEVNNKSIAYTLSYVTDKSFKTFEGDPRQKPFSLQSTGIGKSYLTPETIRYHQDNETYFATHHYQKYPLSDYYKKRIWKDPQIRTIVGERVSQELQDKTDAEDKKFIEKFGEQRFASYIYDKKLEQWIKEQKRETKLLD